MIHPGFKVCERRLQKGWTQAELAERAGIAQANLSNIEKGKRDFTVSMLFRLAAALDVRPAELIENENTPEPIVLTRAQIETLAAAVIDPHLKTSAEIQSVAELFRAILPTEQTRGNSTRDVQLAWIKLKQCFSAAEIRGITQRINDARQRAHAQKTN